MATGRRLIGANIEARTRRIGGYCKDFESVQEHNEYKQRGGDVTCEAPSALSVSDGSRNNCDESTVKMVELTASC